MRVIVVDDQFIFAEAAAALLARNGHHIVGCHAGVEDADEQIAAGEADVVLIGLDAEGRRCQSIALLAQHDRMPAIVAMSDGADGGLLADALEAGADAVFVKTEGVEELERLLGELLERRSIAVPGRRAAKLWSRAASAAARRTSGVAGMPSVTSREREVLSGLARGESTAHIARRLGVGTATVRTHVQNLFYKFGTHSRLELLAQARRVGLLPTAGSIPRARISRPAGEPATLARPPITAERLGSAVIVPSGGPAGERWPV